MHSACHCTSRLNNKSFDFTSCCSQHACHAFNSQGKCSQYVDTYKPCIVMLRTFLYPHKHTVHGASLLQRMCRSLHST